MIPAKPWHVVQWTSFYESIETFVLLYVKHVWGTISDKNAVVQQGKRQRTGSWPGRGPGLRPPERGGV